MSSHQRAWCHPHLSVLISPRVLQSSHRIRVTMLSCEHQRRAVILQYSTQSRSTIQYSEGGSGEITSLRVLTTPDRQQHAYDK